VVFSPPTNVRDLESLAQFFAKKQFGRAIVKPSDMTRSIAVAADFLGCCNDFCRPTFYKLIADWFNESSHPQAVAALESLLSDQIISEPFALDTSQASLALIDEIYAKAGAPTLWLLALGNMDAMLGAVGESPPQLDGPQKFNLVYRSRVAVRPDGFCIAASHVARALLCATSLRAETPLHGSDYVGGWRVCR
jgi:hypothetical protein